MAVIFRRHFQKHFREWKVLVFVIRISLKFVPKRPIDNNIGLDNGLTPHRRQAIIWTNADPINWRIYAALGGGGWGRGGVNNNFGTIKIISDLWATFKQSFYQR